MEDSFNSCYFNNILKKYKMVAILIASAFTTMLLLLLVRMPCMINGNLKNIIVDEQNGVYDLTHIKNFSSRVAALQPSSVYYPNLLLTPQNANMAVPVNTDKYDKLRVDYLSQRFIVKLPYN